MNLHRYTGNRWDVSVNLETDDEATLASRLVDAGLEVRSARALAHRLLQIVKEEELDLVERVLPLATWGSHLVVRRLQPNRDSGVVILGQSGTPGVWSMLGVVEHA